MSDNPTVMFVDDEERILRSLSVLFRGQYNVITCTSGREALQIAAQQKIHVLVSDQRMPEMIGVDLLRQMRELSPATMRLLLTGYSDLTSIIGSINEGEVFRFIQKPWQTDELKKTLAEAVEIALSTEEDVVAMPTPATAGAGAQILVIDSDSDVIEQVRQALNGEYAVRHVSGLDEALEIIASEDVAVVVSEAKLAGQDLTTALKTIKRFNPNIVTIVMTSFSDTGVLVELINHGQIFRFLPKPIRKGLLEMSLRAALRQHGALKGSPRLLDRHRVEPMKKDSDVSMGERIMRMLRNMRERREPAESTRD
jgi:DNA-binding NtrC family response regulator